MAAASPLANSHTRNSPGKKKSSTEPNVLNVVLGNLLVKPWYPSLYPEDLVGRRVDRLYVCQWCFRYSKELMPYLAHMKVCPYKDEQLPGSLIYSRDDHSIYEVDGEEHKLFSQNLSLFAKLFLDTKSVFYDVATFRYYLLALADPTTRKQQVVGFFSKEKMSWDNNNLACILVFPPWQKRGLGQILMGTSYELSKREGRLGGPEKPLSSLGKRGYLAYWSAAICRSILALSAPQCTVQQIVQDTWILPEDVMDALKEMAILDSDKRSNREVVLDKSQLRAWADAHHVALSPPVIRSAFTAALGDSGEEQGDRRDEVDDVEEEDGSEHTEEEDESDDEHDDEHDNIHGYRVADD